MGEKWILSFTLDLNIILRVTSLLGSILFGLGTAYYLGFRQAERPRWKKIRDTKDNDEIEEIVGRLKLDEDSLKELMKIMEEEMNKALNPTEGQSSELKMLPSFIYGVPKKNLSGKYLVIDLGGKNFRVAEVDLHDDRNIEERTKLFMIPDRLLSADGEELFAHIASCLGSFMRLRNLAYRKTRLPLSFCFSFPCKLTSINSAVMLHWAKGFNCKNTIGKDVVGLLQHAVDVREETHVAVTSILNDTVGCMMSCSYKEKNCCIGAIFGSGTNACYVENMDRLKGWEGLDRENHKHIIINVEWGALGDNGSLEFLRTSYDHEIDNLSVNPKCQTFEKMISALYMGDLAWIIIQELISKDLLLRGVLNKNQKMSGYLPSLVDRGILNAKKVSDIEAEEGVNFKRTKQIMSEMGLKDASYDDCAIVKYVCDLVCTRSAQLAAAGLATLINHVNIPNVVIGVDGSMFRYHPKFKQNLEVTVSRLVNRDLSYRILLNADGGAKGAALVAAIETEKQRNA